MATKQRFIRLSFFAKRKSHLTENEFHEYWTQRHRALAADWLAKHGVVRYTQFGKYHTHSSAQSSAEADFPALQGLPKLEFDGVAEFLMPDAASFHKAREDPYYQAVVFPDEEKLFEWETAKWTVGWEEVWIKDGKVVEPET
ncbi:hypothetical protein H2200_011724 [Cladophialophora chaetospira]|uniref:EthD domain-containing protein n=1 Tax=Cladophialophora chaetospira TaxID=386627 RepID=A0AA38WYP3_9EURO|nr:hypothetical protein H2200_011724 [Cladophialophora chaetospira]